MLAPITAPVLSFEAVATPRDSFVPDHLRGVGGRSLSSV
jgi:hypothetical protein